MLVVNAGSTSLKLHLVAEDETVDRPAGIPTAAHAGVAAVAHRIVHGGPRLRRPVVVDEEVRAVIVAAAAFAPLHNAAALRMLAEAIEVFPDVPHVAVFDTGFHARMPAAAAAYAVPRRWRDRWGIRRYGFHGLSVAWSSARATEMLAMPNAPRLVVCHLGGGSSVTAVRGGRSVDTTMGFSPLDGVPMATRSGALDPGAVLHILRSGALGLEAVEDALAHDSGLRALAGGAGDMRDIERRAADGDRAARLAFDVYAGRVAGAVAAMTVAAGGLDALVFTAGIGEGSAQVRARVCDLLHVLGVHVDADANSAAEPDCDIASRASGCPVLVIRAREELVAARATRALLAS